MLVSGGQAGADLAAFDVALLHGFPQDGWVPKGRKNEEGQIPERYRVRETQSPRYLVRTESNVRDSDGTVVFTLAPEATGGSLATIRLANQLNKPLLHVSRSSSEEPARLLAEFVEAHGILALNVAGSRESKEPGIHRWVMEVLEEAFFGSSSKRFEVRY